MNISVKKFSKKSLSLLIALIMVFSALPLTPPISADAATMSETLLNDRHGLVTNGSDSRMKNSNKQYQIVNDQKENNTNAGVLHFNLSKYSDKKIESVQFNAQLDSKTGDSEIRYMNFYYSTTLNGKDSQYLNKNGKETNNAGIGYGAGTTANEKYLKHLIGHYDENSDRLFQIDYKEQNPTSQKNKDVTEEIKQIILSGKTDLYIIVMHSNAGGADKTNGWSDALISPAKINFTISYSDYTTQELIELTKKRIDSNDFSAKTGNDKVMYFGNQTTGMETGVSGVLYSNNAQNAYLDGNWHTWNMNGNSNTEMQAKVMATTNRIVYLYSGEETVIKLPVMAEFKMYGSTVDRYRVNYIACNTSDWVIHQNWTVPTAWYKWDTNTTSTEDGLYDVSYDPNHDVANFTGNSGGATGNWNFKNVLTYNGSLNFDSNNSMTLNNPRFKNSVDIYASWWGGEDAFSNVGHSNVALGDTGTPVYKVFNYSPMAEKLAAAKLKYQEVSANESKYTPDSVLGFYKAVYGLLDYDPNNYDFSTDNAFATASSDMNTAITNYNNAELVEAYYTVTFYNYDDYVFMLTPTTTIEVQPGTTISQLPNNTATKSIGNNQHEEYVWINHSDRTNFTSSTVINSDMIVGEIKKTVNCTYDENDATCMSKALCRVCREPVGNLKPHSYTKETFVDAVGDDNSYTKYTCTMCGREDETVKARDYTDQSSYWEIYRALRAQAKDKIAENAATNGTKYTSASINALENAIARVREEKVGDKTKSNIYIENENKILREATNELKLNQYSITVKYVDENGKELAVGEKGATSKTYPAVDYGTIQNIVAPTSYDGKEYIVYKWTRDIQGNNTISGLNSSSLGVVVKGEAQYYVYLKKASLDSAVDNNSAIVKLNNRSNKVMDVGCVVKGDQRVTITGNKITLTDLSTNPNSVTLTAPNYSFYTLSGFKINGKTVTNGSTVQIDSETVIKPEYTPINTITITVGSGVAGGNVSTSWDSRVKLTSTLTPTDSQLIKWTANINGANVVWGYGETLSFQATKSCTVRCELISKDMATPSVSVDYVSYNLYKANTITAVSRIAVPEGYTVVEYGTILKTSNNLNSTTPSLSAVESATYKKTNAGGVFKATQQITGTNQFAMNFFAATDYEEMYVGAVAYLVYKQANSNTEYVIYSNTNGGKVVTSSYNKTAVGNN